MENTIEDSFQMKLFKQLNKEAGIGDNVVYSPISIYILLALLANGSASDTEEDLLYCLKPQSQSPSTISHLNTFIETLQNKMSQLSSCISIASLLATNNEPYEAFASICQKYNAEITKLNSVKDINDWVKSKTNNMIPSAIDSIDNMSFILINAVYFKGTWLDKFSVSNTHKAEFQSTNDKVDCKMMTQHNVVSAIYGNSDYDAIQLSYSESNDIRAAYIRPKEESIDDFIDGLTNKKLSLILEELQRTSYRMKIGIPKMNIKGDYKLINALEEIGLGNVFGGKGNIPKMVKNFGGIDDISQTCVIKVDENGTEACAVTKCSGKYGRLKEIDIDSSFLFVLFHKEYTEHFLFIAKVEDPSA